MTDIVTICCVCEKVRDDVAGNRREGELWREFPVYLAEHGLAGKNLRLSHTYCPSCMKSFQDVSITGRREPDESEAMNATYHVMAGERANARKSP